MQTTVEFELIGDGPTYRMIENGQITDDSADEETYQNYVIARRQLGAESGIEIIPAAFHSFMATHASVNAPIDSDNDWATLIAPHLPTATTDAVFGFQREAVCRMVRAKRCMNATSMGCGKSVQALCSLAALRDRPTSNDLILCPGYLRQNWRREVEQWLGAKAPAIHVIDKAGGANSGRAVHTFLHEPGIKIVSYDMAATMLSKCVDKNMSMFNTVICDESHYVKECKTKRFKWLRAPITRAKHVFLLTGTPAPNRPKELFSQFSLLHPTVFTNRTSFAKRYCDGYIDHFNVFNDRGQSHVDELAYMFSKIVIRIRRENVLEDLPEVMRIRKLIDGHPTAKFKKLQATFLKELGKINTDKSATFKVQSLASEMFRETCAIKIKPVLEYLKDYCSDLSSLEKTVVFCKHQTMMTAIQSDVLDPLNVPHICISGHTNIHARPDLIKKFIEDPHCKIALLTIGSCATGLNITPIANMIFTELTWSPSDLNQCEARISRIGGASRVQRYAR